MDSWVQVASDSQAYKQFGNAVTASLFEAIATNIKTAILAANESEELNNLEYIASFSGGKDSMATIILAHEHNEPLDLIIFSEVMFDDTTSGELPEHIEFIKKKCIPLFASWGYKTEILHSDVNYMDCFNHIVTRSKVAERNGKKQGFPMSGRCAINNNCKVKPINDFFKAKDPEQVTQYIGIAIDEPKRLERLRDKKPIRISLLEKYGYMEKMAFELCEKYGL